MLFNLFQKLVLLTYARLRPFQPSASPHSWVAIVVCVFASHVVIPAMGAQTQQSGQTSRASLVQVVQQAVPKVTWVPPVTMLAGEALSSRELNATANVPGTFRYSPDADSLLLPGKQKLSVRFQPSDTNYAEVLQTAFIQVIAGHGTGKDFRLEWRAALPVRHIAGVANATVQFALVPEGRLNDTVNLSCYGAPGVSCTFSQQAVTIGADPVPVQVAVRIPESLFGEAITAGVIPIFGFTMLFRRRAGALLAVLTFLCMALALVGCGTTRPLRVSIVGSTGSQTRTLVLDRAHLGL